MPANASLSSHFNSAISAVIQFAHIHNLNEPRRGSVCTGIFTAIAATCFTSFYRGVIAGAAVGLASYYYLERSIPKMPVDASPVTAENLETKIQDLYGKICRYGLLGSNSAIAGREFNKLLKVSVSSEKVANKLYALKEIITSTISPDYPKYLSAHLELISTQEAILFSITPSAVPILLSPNATAGVVALEGPLTNFDASIPNDEVCLPTRAENDPDVLPTPRTVPAPLQSGQEEDDLQVEVYGTPDSKIQRKQRSISQQTRMTLENIELRHRLRQTTILVTNLTGIVARSPHMDKTLPPALRAESSDADSPTAAADAVRVAPVPAPRRALSAASLLKQRTPEQRAAMEAAVRDAVAAAALERQAAAPNDRNIAAERDSAVATQADPAQIAAAAITTNS